MSRQKNFLVYGVGVNDADYDVEKRPPGAPRWRCPYYRCWNSMLERCYSERYQAWKPTYVGCSVCPDWLRFSSFKTWMEAQDWHGNVLDKDLLVPGNRVYSPETCVFVSRKLNQLLVRPKRKTDLPLGVDIHMGGRFRARLSDPTVKNCHIGFFDTPGEAAKAYQLAKSEQLERAAEATADPRVAEALRRHARRYLEGLVT